MKQQHLRGFGLVALFTLYLASCGITGKEFAIDDGTQRLFDGSSLEGWTIEAEEESTDAIFSVQDGVLHCTGVPTAVLRTTEEFENYELNLEWRWAPGTEGGNSGLLLHCSTPRYRGIWPRSIEAQLKSGAAAGFYLMGEGVELEINGDKERRTGSWIPRTRGAEEAIGEWNHMRVLCVGDRIGVWLNGVLANEGFEASESRGAIALQSEGAEIHFRRVDLRSLERKVPTQ